VSVNGVVAGIGDSADPARDRVELDGERVRLDRPVYWIFHKPAGVLTTRRDPEGRATVFDWLPDVDARLFPVGRLDRDTSGLLLLTNDGDLAHALLHPSLGSEREYQVTVRGTLAERTVERLERGVRIDDGWTAPSRVTRQRSEREPERTHFHLTLAEGRKRQIRRALRVLGHPVVQLVRVRLGPLRLGRLPRGEARSLRRDEIAALRKHVAELRSAPAKRRRRRR